MLKIEFDKMENNIFSNIHFLPSYTQYLWESGIIRHLIDKYFQPIPVCDLNQRRPTDSINLEDFRSVFFLLIIGFVLSLLVFGFELIIGIFQKRRVKFVLLSQTQKQFMNNDMEMIIISETDEAKEITSPLI